MSFPPELPELLRESLTQPVDPRARATWAPSLGYGRHFAAGPRDARTAAVMLLLVSDQGRWRLPLTLRPAGMQRHGGQVCLPGGVCEPGETPEEGAARELAEELGTPDGPIQMLGRLTPIYVFNSGFQVTPCVAWTPQMWELRPQPAEVERAYLPTLEEIVGQGPPSYLEIDRAGLRFSAPYMTLAGDRVWGATCMILGELNEHLRRLAKPAVGPQPTTPAAMPPAEQKGRPPKDTRGNHPSVP